jgi:hypothetical protein
VEPIAKCCLARWAASRTCSPWTTAVAPEAEAASDAGSAPPPDLANMVVRCRTGRRSMIDCLVGYRCVPLQ